MVESLLTLNNLVATGTLLLEIVCVLVLLDVFVKGRISQQFVSENTINKYVNNKNVLLKIFILSLVSSILTLVYSEYFGVVPCALCWFERIFMYGIVFMSSLALFRKEEKFILPYIFKFSILGGLFAIYHHILQMTASLGSHLPCPVSGGDCGKRIIFEYGHITFPYMAFILFVFFIALIIWNKRREN